MLLYKTHQIPSVSNSLEALFSFLNWLSLGRLIAQFMAPDYIVVQYCGTSDV